jgi:hypothetical protein
MAKLLRARDELCFLTDSLPSAIRWRLKDYEAMLKAELRILSAEPAWRRREERTARLTPGA